VEWSHSVRICRHHALVPSAGHCFRPDLRTASALSWNRLCAWEDGAHRQQSGLGQSSSNPSLHIYLRLGGLCYHVEWCTAFQTLRAWLRPCSCLTICSPFLFFSLFAFSPSSDCICRWHPTGCLLDSAASTGPSRPPSPRPAFGHDDCLRLSPAMYNPVLVQLQTTRRPSARH